LNAPNLFGFTAGLLADLAQMPAFVAIEHIFAQIPLGDSIEIVSTCEKAAPLIAHEAAVVDVTLSTDSSTSPQAVAPDETAAAAPKDKYTSVTAVTEVAERAGATDANASAPRAATTTDHFFTDLAARDFDGRWFDDQAFTGSEEHGGAVLSGDSPAEVSSAGRIDSWAQFQSTGQAAEFGWTDRAIAPVASNNSFADSSALASFLSVAFPAGGQTVAILPAPGGFAGTATAQQPLLDTNAIRASLQQQGLRFEANVGQTDSQVKYLAHASGYTIYLAANADTVFKVNGTQVDGTGSTSVSSTAAFRMELVGANPAPQSSVGTASSSVTNYFIGNDPSQWHTNVANYNSVSYQNVYPGIDLNYHSAPGQALEYDFVVAPGASSDRVQLHFTGADHLQLDAEGNLIIDVNGVQMQQFRPTLYQEINGARHEVAGSFMLLGTGDVGFHVSSYDPRMLLVIDPTAPPPTLTYLGGAGDDYISAVAADSTGVYVTGGTSSNNFPTSVGAPQGRLNPDATGNAFVTKLDPLLRNVIYSTYLGGSVGDTGSGIAVDTAGNAYITGTTSSLDFPTQNPYQATSAGGSDAFVTKINAGGNALVYSTYLGGAGDDDGNAIALGSTGMNGANAYVTGQTDGNNFPTTRGAAQAAAGGGQDAFVTEFTTDGTQLVYSTLLGGAGTDKGNGIAVDPSTGAAYVTGLTASNNFPISAGAFQAALKGTTDAFVTKVNPAGTAFDYSTYLGGTSSDEGHGITVQDGYAFVTGDTQSNNFPTSGAPVQNANAGGTDAFITKVNKTGTALVFSTYFRGAGSDIGMAIVLRPQGQLGADVFITGSTTSNNLTLVNPFQNALQGGTDAFYAGVDSSGATIVSSSYLGGSNNDDGRGIAFAGSLYIGGETKSNNLPTLLGTYQLNNAGGADGYVFQKPS
jgi:hypothetical protein